MAVRKWILVISALGGILPAHGLLAQGKGGEGKAATAEAKATTPAEMKWGLAMAGMEQVNLVGNPSEPGPYTLRLKFPSGYKPEPHTHPDIAK